MEAEKKKRKLKKAENMLVRKRRREEAKALEEAEKKKRKLERDRVIEEEKQRTKQRVTEIATALKTQLFIDHTDLSKQRRDIDIAGPWGPKIAFHTPTWYDLRRELKRLWHEDHLRTERLNKLHDMGLINIYRDDLENIDLDKFKKFK